MVNYSKDLYNADLYDTNLDQTGQHYMIDKTLIEFIVASAILSNEDVVLEIGYGKGALTKYLVKESKVVAIDIEKNDLPFITSKLKVVQGNILDEYFNLLKMYKFNKIVSNIPYNLSEPLMRLIFKSSDVKTIVLTVGKNFADILIDKNNRIGIIANHLYNVEILKIVPAKSFRPMPRVQSAVIKLELRNFESSKSKYSKSADSVGEIYKKLIFLDDKKLKNAFEKILVDRTKKEIKELTTMPFFTKKLYELDNNEFILLDKFVHLLSLEK